MKLKFQSGHSVASQLLTSTPIFISAVTVALLMTSQAQAQGYGYGLQPGMQGCSGGYGQAQGAVSESDEAQEMERNLADLKARRKETQANLRELRQEQHQLANVINQSITPKWAEAFMKHMDIPTYNCCVEGDVPVVISDAGPKRRAPPRLPVPGEKATRKKKPKPAPEPESGYSMNDSDESSGRMPASVPAAGSDVGDDGLGPDLGEGGPGAGGAGDNPSSPSSCYPKDSMYSMAKWKGVACVGPGKINPRVCSAAGAAGPLFATASGDRGSDLGCDHAITRYGTLAREIDEAAQANKDLNLEILNLNDELHKQQRNDRLEAGCEECQRAKANRGGSGGNIGPTMRAMSPVLEDAAGLRAGVSIGGVRLSAGISTGGPGPLALPYAAQGYGYPMAQNGYYGAVPGGVNNGFGCSAGVGGGGYQNGPYGLGGPSGQYPDQRGGAFGYPPGYMPGYPQMGGAGAYNPGYGPGWVGGPWGNNPGGISAQLSSGGGGGFGSLLGGLLGGVSRVIGGLFGGGGGGFSLSRPGYGLAGSGGYPGYGFGGQGGAPQILPASYSGAAGAFGRTGTPFRSGYGVSGVPGGFSFAGQNNNNLIGQQVQSQQLYNRYYSAGQALGQYNNGLSSFYGGSNYNSNGTYVPPYLPVQTNYGY